MGREGETGGVVLIWIANFKPRGQLTENQGVLALPCAPKVCPILSWPSGDRSRPNFFEWAKPESRVEAKEKFRFLCHTDA